MTDEKPRGKATIFGGIGAVGILALKFKAVFMPLLTMLASIGVYTMMFGYSYAIAIVGLILIHEFGHWIWMKATGLDPKVPMFIPGIGAFTAMQNMPPDDAGRAWVAFAGPLIGGIAAAVLFWLGLHTNNDWLIAAGNTGFFLNLFQLIPAKPFDGGFVVGVVSRWLLVPGTVLLIGAGLLLRSPLLLIISVISVLGLLRQLRAPRTENVVAANPAQRAAIGFAYISLCGMLAYLYALTAGDVHMGR
jgi:Zn-dependent protease